MCLTDNDFCISNLNAHFKKIFTIPCFLVIFSSALLSLRNKRGKGIKLVTRILPVNIFLKI